MSNQMPNKLHQEKKKRKNKFHLKSSILLNNMECVSILFPLVSKIVFLCLILQTQRTKMRILHIRLIEKVKTKT